MKYSDIKHTVNHTADNVDATDRAMRRFARIARIEALADTIVAIAMGACVGCASVLGCSFAIATTIKIWRALICGG